MPEIDARRAFRGPATKLGVDELTENRRGSCEWECTADAELRGGGAPAALAADREHGRVVAGTSVDAARAQGWEGHILSGEGVMGAFRQVGRRPRGNMFGAFWTDAGRVVEVPSGFLDAGRLAHVDAITGHKGSGNDPGRCSVLEDEALPREWGYVALSPGLMSPCEGHSRRGFRGAPNEKRGRNPKVPTPLMVPV